MRTPNPPSPPGKAVGVPSLGEPMAADRNGHGQSPPDVADALDTDELLDALGPAWSAMSAAQRLAYGPTPSAIGAEPQSLGAAQFAATYPALALWQREVRAGRRSATFVDALTQAARREQRIVDLFRDGLEPDDPTPLKLRAEADEFLRLAAEETRRGAA